jgi:hypothetical protein
MTSELPKIMASVVQDLICDLQEAILNINSATLNSVPISSKQAKNNCVMLLILIIISDRP